MSFPYFQLFKWQIQSIFSSVLHSCKEAKFCILMIIYVSFGLLQGLSGFTIKKYVYFNKMLLNSVTLKRLDNTLRYKFMFLSPFFSSTFLTGRGS